MSVRPELRHLLLASAGVCALSALPANAQTETDNAQEPPAAEAEQGQTAVTGDIIGLTDVEFAAVEARLADHQANVHQHKAVQQDSLDEGEVELFGFSA